MIALDKRMSKILTLRIFVKILKEEKFGISILIFLWVLVQIIAYVHFDMRASIDSDLYVVNSIKLIKGVLPQGREFFYLTYSLLIAVLHLLGLKPDYVIFFHLISALAAIICIYKLTQLISKNNHTAFIAAIFYIHLSFPADLYYDHITPIRLRHNKSEPTYIPLLQYHSAV